MVQSYSFWVVPKTEIQFTIGQLARMGGVNVQTVRFYERQGILEPILRKESGYRLYNADSLKRLHFIRQAKDLGFSLKEIQSLLTLRVRTASRCDQVRQKAQEKLHGVREKIKHLQNLERNLKRLVRDCKRRVISDSCPILEKMEN